MKISKKLKQFVKENGLDWDVEPEEHYGCFNKGCSHWEDWIRFWKEGKKDVYRWSFRSDCSEEFIIKILKEKLS